jgi:hypothetical protein
LLANGWESVDGRAAPYTRENETLPVTLAAAKAEISEMKGSGRAGAWPAGKA